MPNSWPQARYHSGERVAQIGYDTDCTGFLYLLRRPFHWLIINEHGVHTFANEQLGLTVRDEGTHNPVFMHLWATYLSSGTTKRCSTSEAALEGNNKERAQAPTSPRHDHNLRGGSNSKYRLSGKAATRITRNVRRVVQCLSPRARPRASHCVDAMCELFAESFSDFDEDISHHNLSNALMRITTSYHIGNTLEACLTEEELGRLSLSFHFSLDCLCENWYMPFEPGVIQ